ncbi:Dipeptidyl aminopeptidase/acylaminoacyl peptidase [Pedobacter caeni]|uniref:Dipeptidyl aminopeptidase/acylaminoacyl peptidase n=2 Tax=Pedobacter caeni TaxID=288992 RepID=A0A1M4TUE7_9SPHI|nr:Dipeptidyl aminopeptidase/acylaminoacyl peptidase [Pedobacter caeni]
MKTRIEIILLLTLSMHTTMTRTTHAQTNALPGNPTLVSSEKDLQKLIDAGAGDYKYQVEDYFSNPISSDFELSPNGRYLSFKERDDKGKSHVMIKELSTGKITPAIEEKENVIIGYGWATDTRLLYLMDKAGNENYHLYAVDIDGANNRDLTPYEGVRASILERLPENPESIILLMNKDNKLYFEPYRVNIITGESTKLYDNADPKNPINDFKFDKDGNLRGFTQIFNGKEVQYFYRPVGTVGFKLLNTASWYRKFTVLAFNYASKNPDDAYVLTNVDSDKARIVLFDMRKNKVIKEIFSNKDYDVSEISLSGERNWEIDYLTYEGEKRIIKPVSRHFKTIYKNLEKQFRGYEFQITGKTNDEKQYLVKVSSDRLFGGFYRYDTRTGKAILLHDLMPQLKEEDMAVMRPITFTSRDGLTLHGYITLPKEALNGGKVPTIVNPHGGPHNTRDSWGFNREAQLFASRGYATLQINFRISNGYGAGFYKAGFKQAGRKIMDDLEDGVQYSIAQGWVDPDKIGIYGGSHGGYATLMGLIKSPNLYKAGVDYVGISNIATFFDGFPEYWKILKEMVEDVWYDLDDPKEAQIAKDVSPIFHVDEIKSPLFVVQGGNDPRVNILESDQIVEALRKRGVDVPYMVKYDEGHGFLREENQIVFYKAMVGFWGLHLR